MFGIGEHHTRAFAVCSRAMVHAAIARATSRITLAPLSAEEMRRRLAVVARAA